jgi:hypothetical protein
VKEGVLRDSNRNWFLGDAALEIAPMGDDKSNSGAYANLREFAEELSEKGTELSFESLRKYRDVAAAWPHETRVSCSHKVHAMLMSAENQRLIKPGMTVTKAHEALGYNNTGRTGLRSDVPDKVAAVQKYLEDPEVMKQVAAAPAVKTAVKKQIEKEQDAAFKKTGITHVPDMEQYVDRLLQEITNRMEAIYGVDPAQFLRKFRTEAEQELTGIAHQAATLAEMYAFDPDAELHELTKEV